MNINIDEGNGRIVGVISVGIGSPRVPELAREVDA